MGWIISAAGLLVVLVALWDIFHTLWHPGGFGGIARRVFELVWRATKHVLPGRTRQLAGPIGILGTVMLWTGLVVIGWTLVYLPHTPQGFNFASALRPEESSNALTALYLSLVTLATLGFGDVSPADPVLRLLTPFEALLGFVLLTVAISWILQVYPALGRRRSVAKRLNILQSSHATDVVAGGEPCVASRILDAVTEGVIQAETDLLQYAESYYFLEEDQELSLAATLSYALELAEAGRESSSREVHLSAGMLTAAVESLALRLDRAYLKTGSPAPDVLASYSADHGFEPRA
jgi:Ion channel